MREKIELIEKLMKEKFSGECTGHDWYHIDRVRKLSLKISGREGGDKDLIEVAALMHDVADYKFHDGDDSIGVKETRRILSEFGFEDEIIKKVEYIVDNVSFKGLGNSNNMELLEGKIVQDADRLDALGAIGIARTFAYGGKKGQPIYDPELTPEKHSTFEQYKSGGKTTINHFYEKLLHLSIRMNTKTGQELAQKRQEILEDFLDNFLNEWEVN